MAYTIAFFGTKPYDEASFNDKNKEYGFELRYYKGHLNKHNVILTQNVDAVCIFVNDTADAEVLHMMADNGVKLLALRCAGYNNVDLKAAADCGITVVRVPAYSPYAVAEYTVALMLSLNRKIPRATWRTRDGNFSLHGLLGFYMYGKTVGIIGTGKIAKKLIMILRGFGMNVLAYDLYPDYNFAREHQVVYYAKKMNMQPSALCRLVKKESGHTAMEIINRTLIMDAKTQLRTENTQVKDIALSLGFNNAAFFNKFFKKHTGVTPQMFRNSVR